MHEVTVAIESKMVVYDNCNLVKLLEPTFHDTFTFMFPKNDCMFLLRVVFIDFGKGIWNFVERESIEGPKFIV